MTDGRIQAALLGEGRKALSQLAREPIREPVQVKDQPRARDSIFILTTRLVYKYTKKWMVTGCQVFPRFLRRRVGEVLCL